MRRASPDTDQIGRSLLQKAVRRGDLRMTKIAINYIIHKNDFDWLRKRLAVIMFEECWSYSLEITYDKDKEIVARHYTRIAEKIKNKNAAGLGSLAYAFSQGDTSVLYGDSEDKSIKIIAEAIKRPRDFWEWARKQELDESPKLAVENADKGFRKAGWPWDRAFAQAAAYLAISTDIPKPQLALTNQNEEFPLWIGIDKHTPQGKAAIRDAAKRIGFNSNKALWLAFYFESAKCNSISYSPWWEKEIMWRMKKLGLQIEEGQKIWEEIKPIVIEILEGETQLLKEKLLAFDISEKTSEVVQISIF